MKISDNYVSKSFEQPFKLSIQIHKVKSKQPADAIYVQSLSSSLNSDRERVAKSRGPQSDRFVKTTNQLNVNKLTKDLQLTLNRQIRKM
jgi:hypothetical protein